jgi:hypothetical protein
MPQRKARRRHRIPRRNPECQSDFTGGWTGTVVRRVSGAYAGGSSILQPHTSFVIKVWLSPTRALPKLALACILSVLLFPASAFPADDATEQVVARMMEADGKTTPQLRNYSSVRRYVLENKRFNQRAEMAVKLTFRYPGQKHFEVLMFRLSLKWSASVFR